MQEAPVLVVDDDQDVRETIIDVLAHAGYEALGAGNGRAALDLLRAGMRPALVLLDLMMPVMTGAEFRDEQLADPTLAAIPVVVFSADARVEEKSANLSPNAILTKPIQLRALLEVVQRYVHGERP